MVNICFMILSSKVTLLESRNRLGGRVHTDYSFGCPVDMGASWKVHFHFYLTVYVHIMTFLFRFSAGLTAFISSHVAAGFTAFAMKTPWLHWFVIWASDYTVPAVTTLCCTTMIWRGIFCPSPDLYPSFSSAFISYCSLTVRLLIHFWISHIFRCMTIITASLEVQPKEWLEFCFMVDKLFLLSPIHPCLELSNLQLTPTSEIGISWLC